MVSGSGILITFPIHCLADLVNLARLSLVHRPALYESLALLGAMGDGGSAHSGGVYSTRIKIRETALFEVA